METEAHYIECLRTLICYQEWQLYIWELIYSDKKLYVVTLNKNQLQNEVMGINIGIRSCTRLTIDVLTVVNLLQHVQTGLNLKMLNINFMRELLELAY